ncbi:sulfate adenylyltransferase subunit CysN [Falsiroseomonas selenitidurans]|uniref:Multifunctional fusion protein n=1 Tax=Falsiroseomonas selenitidurans TaxID=2716335 RepID=A0ABX1E2R4_9PROT|nr:sulfate adenylyltransferase subunit CysN [Falsiroseomonas selenitidurans]NKC31474.1 sulfate adenylyltransferase subunit CysN [Falsiroseomonas selenitidurans]
MDGTTPARGLLRLLTCGSVDDGKSTLIGRLLYDSQMIMEDTLASITRDSRKHGTVGEEVDLALLVDGLEAERQQGITIDVAYRFFTTPRRSFIVADCPGHEQYTRNMATGASNSELAIILVDARKGLLTQTRRHSYICSLLGIRHVVLAVNKIDLVNFDRQVFDRIVGEYATFAANFGFRTLVPIPTSGRFGDNVTTRSGNTPWYRGETLLAHLESVGVAEERAGPFRFPVQWVNRPNQDFRGFSGSVAGGGVSLGERVVVASSGIETQVARILGPSGEQQRAEAGEAVTICLADEVDVARGDVLVPTHSRPAVADQLAAHLLWMDEEPMLPGRQYLMRLGNSWTSASVTAIKHRVDVATLEHGSATRLTLNEIGFCNFALAQRLPFDPYADNRLTGAFILVDRFTNRTAGCGMIAFPLRRATNVHQERFLVDRAARAAALGQRPMVLWFTGLSGSGKSTVSKLVEQALHRMGRHTYSLDGDNLRHGLNRDLGFTDQDRVENIRRVGEVAKLFVDAGLIVLCSFISPFRAERDMVREMLGEGDFVEIFVDTPIEECIRRDAKGLYARAMRGEIANFTGVSSPYEPPERAELVLDGGREAPEAQAQKVLDVIGQRLAREAG